MSVNPSTTPMTGLHFWKALGTNTLWVNVSGLPRYFLLIIPMLHETLPENPGVAPVTMPILLSWGIWTVLFMLVTTGFYWIYFDRYGYSITHIIKSALWVTTATIGLTWLGIFNMGLLPITFLVAAMSWGPASSK